VESGEAHGFCDRTMLGAVAPPIACGASKPDINRGLVMQLRVSGILKAMP
jgi:hypothetical protein